jgi:hypothetical protein
MVHKINKKENLEGESWNKSTERKEMIGKVIDADEKAVQVKFLRLLVGVIVKDTIPRGK